MNISYWLWMTGSILICTVLHYFLAGKMKNRLTLSVLTCIMGTLLGAACARIFYCLLQMEYVIYDGIWTTLISNDISFTSFYGGMAGVILAAVLAGKCTGNRAMDSLNVYAPAGALMAALTRFGEYFWGIQYAGNYMELPSVHFFPLCIGNEWDEWYLAVFMLSGFAYLAVFIVSLFRFKEKRFMRTLFYLCLCQIILESLRNQSLIWSQFIRVEQLICMLVVETILILMGVRAKGVKYRFLPAVLGVVCAGIFVVVEFAVGGKLFVGTSLLVFYSVMLLGLIVLACAETWLFHRTKK